MSKNLKIGDDVKWNSEKGEVKGKVKKKLTKTSHIKKHVVKATADNPQYLVKSNRTNKLAAHKPTALKKIPKPKKSPG
jgi:hypothetical protein